MLERCREKGTLLHCWWECKLVQPLWRTVWRFLKKLQIELPYDPAIPLLGIHTKETRIERDTCTPMFIAAPFTVARMWKQPRCPSADEWIRNLWYIYTIEYYSAIKKECIWISSNEVDETGAYYTEWSKSERETPVQCINAYIWNSEKTVMLYSRQQKRHKHKEQTLDGGRRWDGLIWEKSTEACILPYVKQMTSASSMHEAGHPKPAPPWDNPEGRGREGAGRGFRMRGHMYTWGWFMLMYGKTHSNIVK